MSGSEQAQALLARFDHAEGMVRAWEQQNPNPGIFFPYWELINEREAARREVAQIAPDLARQVIALSAENADLAAEVARLQAQAGAVAGLREMMWCWSDEAERMRAGVPEEFAHRNARHFHALGRAGALDDCATAIERALAQASAEGEAGAEGVG